MKKASIAIITLIVALCVLDAEAFFGGSAWRRHYRRVRRDRVTTVVPSANICDATCKCKHCFCENCSCPCLVK